GQPSDAREDLGRFLPVLHGLTALVPYSVSLGPAYAIPRLRERQTRAPAGTRTVRCAHGRTASFVRRRDGARVPARSRRRRLLAGGRRGTAPDRRARARDSAPRGAGRDRGLGVRAALALRGGASSGDSLELGLRAPRRRDDGRRASSQQHSTHDVVERRGRLPGPRRRAMEIAPARERSSRSGREALALDPVGYVASGRRRSEGLARGLVSYRGGARADRGTTGSERPRSLPSPPDPSPAVRRGGPGLTARRNRG